MNWRDNPAYCELLAQVYASPEDDTPRLVLADWLIQRGDPWGELITVQCEIARLSAEELDWRLDLRRRERELLKKVPMPPEPK